VPESVAALPMFAELVVEGAAAEMPAGTEVSTGLKIVAGHVVICVGADADVPATAAEIADARGQWQFGLAARVAFPRCLGRG
jgi:transposase